VPNRQDSARIIASKPDEALACPGITSIVDAKSS
jgi:hypothetical protein